MKHIWYVHFFFLFLLFEIIYSAFPINIRKDSVLPGRRAGSPSTTPDFGLLCPGPLTCSFLGITLQLCILIFIAKIRPIDET